jgi:hypothetical protein
MEPQPEDMGIKIAGSVKDLPEIERLTAGIVKVLRKFGGYEPEVDDIWVNQIATYTVYLKKAEIFLDAETATEHTYIRVADIQLKFQRIIENAMHQLALSRNDRMGQQAEADLIGKLRETIEKMKTS